jgi:RNase H-fold protein (predicted Holliday junction resolvase)
MSELFGNNFLGIDWGMSKVGIAFADTETRMAFSICVLKNDKTLIFDLEKLFSEREIGTVVIGVSTRNTLLVRDGQSDVGGASHVNRPDTISGGEKLGSEIEKKHPSMHIEYSDEIFTTKMASANLREHGIRNLARFDDQESARIILQEWLDRNQITGKTDNR